MYVYNKKNLPLHVNKLQSHLNICCNFILEGIKIITLRIMNAVVLVRTVPDVMKVTGVVVGTLGEFTNVDVRKICYWSWSVCDVYCYVLSIKLNFVDGFRFLRHCIAVCSAYYHNRTKKLFISNRKASQTRRQLHGKNMADEKNAPVDNLHTKNGNFICGVVEGKYAIYW